MQHTQPMQLYSGTVLSRAVSHMRLKAVTWKVHGLLGHKAVAGHFGNDACGAHRRHKIVSAHQRAGFGVTGKIIVVAVDDNFVVASSDLVEGATHSQPHGLGEAQAIDCSRLNPAESVGYGCNSNICVQSFTLFFGELFRIFEARDCGGVVEQHCSGHHRPSPAPSPYLINPHNHGKSLAYNAKIVYSSGHGIS